MLIFNVVSFLLQNGKPMSTPSEEQAMFESLANLTGAANFEILSLGVLLKGSRLTAIRLARARYTKSAMDR